MVGVAMLFFESIACLVHVDNEYRTCEFHKKRKFINLDICFFLTADTIQCQCCLFTERTIIQNIDIYFNSIPLPVCTGCTIF